jgi:hypothetical protein
MDEISYSTFLNTLFLFLNKTERIELCRSTGTVTGIIGSNASSSSSAGAGAIDSAFLQGRDSPNSYLDFIRNSVPVLTANYSHI